MTSDVRETGPFIEIAPPPIVIFPPNWIAPLPLTLKLTEPEPVLVIVKPVVTIFALLAAVKVRLFGKAYDTPALKVIMPGSPDSKPVAVVTKTDPLTRAVVILSQPSCEPAPVGEKGVVAVTLTLELPVMDIFVGSRRSKPFLPFGAKRSEVPI